MKLKTLQLSLRLVDSVVVERAAIAMETSKLKVRMLRSIVTTDH